MRHGTYAYQQGCRCAKCRAAVAAAQQRHRRRRKAGLVRRIPVDEAREHLLTLRRMGFTWNAIDKHAGSMGLAKRIAIGKTQWLTPAVADRVLGITVSDLQATEGVLRLSKQTYQQIAEMQAAGYSLRWIRSQVGHVPLQIRDRRPRVWPATQSKIQRLHDELWSSNSNGFRKVCRCTRIAEPETIRRTQAQRRLRARKVAA